MLVRDIAKEFGPRVKVSVEEYGNSPTAQRFGVSDGAMVVGLDTGGPAQQAGMTAPAVIRSIDGQPVTSADSLGPLLHSHTPGESAVVTWVDASGQHTATIQLIAGPAV